MLDNEGVFIEVNLAYERMTGIPRERWVGRRIEDMQKLPEVPKQSATLQALSGKGPATTIVTDESWSGAESRGLVLPEQWGLGRRSAEISPFDNYEQWRQADGSAVANPGG